MSASAHPARPSARLAELGITLPEVAAPVAAYVPAVHVGDLIYTSGQLPFVSGELPVRGRVGEAPQPGGNAAGAGVVSPEQATEMARIATLNALAAIDALVGIDNVQRVVKVNGFVASEPDFGGQPAVVNGASELLGEVFGEAGQHARAAVGVAALPLGAPVEIEIIVQARQ